MTLPEPWIDEFLRRVGSPAQARFMEIGVAISRREGKSKLPMVKLAKRWGISKSGAISYVAGLVKDGWIERGEAEQGYAPLYQFGPKATGLPATPPPVVPAQSPWVAAAGHAWQKFQGVPNYGRLGKALKPLVDEHGPELVLKAWEMYVAHPDGRFGAEYFAAHFLHYRHGSTTARVAPPEKPSWQRAIEQEQIDKARNADVRIHQAVNRATQDRGQPWLQGLTQEAKARGRWAIPYIYEVLQEELKQEAAK